MLQLVSLLDSEGFLWSHGKGLILYHHVPSVELWKFWRTFSHPSVYSSFPFFFIPAKHRQRLLKLRTKLVLSLSFSVLLFTKSEECREVLGLDSST